MHQILFPLMIINVIKNHASKEKPLSITEIQKIINCEFSPLSDKESIMNRSTILRALESLVTVTEVGSFFDFRVVELGTEKRKKFFIECD